MIATRSLAAGLMLLLGSAAAGDEGEAVRGPTLDLRWDLPVTAIAAGGALGLMAMQDELAPRRCRWCSPPALDARVARSVAWRNASAAARSSDVLAVGLGAGALGYVVGEGYAAGDPRRGWANALIVTEATSVAVFMGLGTKYLVGRARPEAWEGGPGGAAGDRNLSFFSDHTTFAFAVASSSTTLLVQQRVPHAALYGAVAFSAATATGYLRMAGRQHYLTDVVAGAAVGTVVGWGIPYLFHGSKLGPVQLVPSPGGIAAIW